MDFSDSGRYQERTLNKSYIFSRKLTIHVSYRTISISLLCKWGRIWGREREKTWWWWWWSPHLSFHQGNCSSLISLLPGPPIATQASSRQVSASPWMNNNNNNNSRWIKILPIRAHLPDSAATWPHKFHAITVKSNNFSSNRFVHYSHLIQIFCLMKLSVLQGV